jgi:tetratricopeptide (TPR) repeat protein
MLGDYGLAEPRPGSVRRDLGALFVESESIEDGVMRIPCPNRTATLILAFFLAAYLVLVPAGAQQSDPQAIYKRFQEYYQAGNYAAAVVEAQKLEAVVKGRFGTNHTNYATALNNLARVYWRQGKYSEAEELFKRALAIREKASVQATLTWARLSTTWPSFMKPRPNTRKRRDCISAR